MFGELAVEPTATSIPTSMHFEVKKQKQNGQKNGVRSGIGCDSPTKIHGGGVYQIQVSKSEMPVTA
jgi:hypothetical protein